jgi:hypothetical protein
MHFRTLKFPICFKFKNLYNLFLSAFISDIEENTYLTVQEHISRFLSLSYPLNLQFSSHKLLLLLI